MRSKKMLKINFYMGYFYKKKEKVNTELVLYCYLAKDYSQWKLYGHKYLIDIKKNKYIGKNKKNKLLLELIFFIYSTPEERKKTKNRSQ